MASTESTEGGWTLVESDSIALEGTLSIPENAKGIVLFAHGSGSSRLSRRNLYVARALERAGFGTLLFDLLTEAEAAERDNVFDVGLLAHRLAGATRWLRIEKDLEQYPIGYFGASTGAAAALIAAAQDPAIGAVVSRGGRPDLAMHCLGAVKAPTLLIVGGEDHEVIALNRMAYARLECHKAIEIVPGATHLFEEPGTLDEVVRLAWEWFAHHLRPLPANDRWFGQSYIFKDRAEAGRKLAAALGKYKQQDPVVLAIPRGGVTVGFEVARALEAPLDVIIARKVGAPAEPELGIGAVADGDHPEGIFNEEAIRLLGIPKDYLDAEVAKQLREIKRRQEAYRGGLPPVRLEGRVVLVVDDGIATGGSVRAALRAIKRAKPRLIVLAVPVAPVETIESLRAEADDVVCLSSPPLFHAVGQFYRDFRQVSDEAVIQMLGACRPGAAARPPA